MASFPKFWKVMGKDLTINMETIPEMKGCMGCCIPEDLTIVVRPDINPQQQVSVLLHESIEQCNFDLNMDLNHQQIIGLELFMYQTIMDNNVAALKTYARGGL